MLISALFRSLCIPLNFNQSFFNHFLVDIVKSNLSFMQTSHFLVPNIINLARIWKKRRYIRRYKCFSHSLAQYHWIILTSYVYFFWIFFKLKANAYVPRILTILFIIIMNQLYRHFRIRIRIKMRVHSLSAFLSTPDNFQ